MKIGVGDCILQVKAIYGDSVVYDGVNRPTLIIALDNPIGQPEINLLLTNDWYIFEEEVTDDEINTLRSNGWVPLVGVESKIKDIKKGFHAVMDHCITFVSHDSLEDQLAVLKAELERTMLEKAALESQLNGGS